MQREQEIIAGVIEIGNQIDAIYGTMYGVTPTQYNDGLRQSDHEYFEYIDKLLILIKKEFKSYFFWNTLKNKRLYKLIIDFLMNLRESYDEHTLSLKNKFMRPRFKTYLNVSTSVHYLDHDSFVNTVHLGILENLYMFNEVIYREANPDEKCQKMYKYVRTLFYEERNKYIKI
jgi:hypothetical protein